MSVWKTSPIRRKTGTNDERLCKKGVMDVLKEYSKIKLKVRSVRNAIKSGFRPAWVELTARDSEFVNRLAEKM